MVTDPCPVECSPPTKAANSATVGIDRAGAERARYSAFFGALALSCVMIVSLKSIDGAE